MPDDSKRQSADLTRQGIAIMQAGRPEEARLKFGEAIEADPQNERAWLWLASLVTDIQHKRYCLDRALDINPDSQARQALVGLEHVAPRPPVEVAALDDLPLPDEIVHAGAERGRRRRVARLVGGGLALLGLVALALWGIPRLRSGDDLHIAVVGPMTGVSAVVGQEIRQSVQLALDRANQTGGVGGRRLVLDVYDDQNDLDLARQRAEEIVRDGRALLVLGHNSSGASLAGGAVYARAGIPAITGTATTDAVTQGNPWYFSTIFTNTQQGRFIAAYLAQVLRQDRATVIYTDDAYGQSLRDAFLSEARGLTTASIAVSPAAPTRDASIQAAVDELARLPEPGPVVLATSRPEARDLLLNIRRRGLNGLILGADVMGSSEFGNMFKDEPEEQTRRGYFTEGMYVSTPLIFDSASIEAQTLAADYQAAYNATPSWRGVKFYDAALAAFYALEQANVANTSDSRAADRENIRRQLESLASIDVALRGLAAPIYFDKSDTGISAISLGQFSGGEVFSAPTQLQAAQDAAADMAKEVAAGNAVQLGDQFYWLVRVVYTGTALNELSSLDSQTATAKADVYVWFRYPGADDATDVRFTNAVDQSLTVGDPVDAGNLNDLQYRLFRVRGDFKQTLDYRDYPFDRQAVGIHFQNDKLPRYRIIYVVDRRGVELSQGHGAGESGSERFMAIDNWKLAGPVRHFQDAVVQESSFGNPRLLGRAARVEYSEFHTEVSLKRDLLSFLVRNLLPLALIVVILYVSLFFPHGEMTSDRISVAVTALLTGAVLLSAIQATLPEVGYTVAIEYGFYIFFLLTLVSVLIAMLGGAWHRRGRDERNHLLDLASRVGFLLLIVAVIATYYVRYR